MCKVDSWELVSAHHGEAYSLIVSFVCFQVSEHSSQKEEDPQVFDISPLCEPKKKKKVSGLDSFQTTGFAPPRNVLNGSPSFVTVEITLKVKRNNTLKAVKTYH